MRRPLAIVALLYAGGLVLAECVSVPLASLWIAALVLTATALLWARARAWLLAAALVALGWLNLTWRTAIVSPDDLRLLLPQAVSVEVTLRGTLPETPSLRMFVRDEEESFRTLATLEVEGLRTREGWQSARGIVLVLTPGELPPDFHAGQRIRVEGILSPPRTALAPGLFDYRAYLRRHGIYFQLRAAGSNSWQVAASKPIPPPFADRFMAWAQGVLRRGLPEDESQRLLWAMTLGWKTALTTEVNEPFMRSGTMHIFAISGLHIALIAGILVSLLRVLQLSRAGCGAVVIPLIWFYTAATGWQPSAIRSTVMMTVIILGWALRRPSDLINSLAAAGFIILLWDPQQLFQASFQLSFFVVLSIALFLPPLEKLRDRLLQTDPLLPSELLPRWRRWLNGPLRWLTTAAATSIAAWLGSMPLTAYYFHLFSPVTLLANLVIVPLSSLALACNLGGLVCGAWWPAVTELFNWSAWFWMWAMIRASEIATQLPGAFFYVRSFTLVETLLWYGLLLGTLSGWLFAAKRRQWTLPLLGLVAIAYGWGRFQQSQLVTLTAIPLSGGSAIYCDSPGGSHDLLIDCGSTNAVEFVIKPFLRAQGVNRLPQFLLTHGDLRCIGGAEDVLREFRVQQVLASGVRQLSATYRRVISNMNQTPARLRVVQRGDAIGPWQVLHPAATDRFKQADDNAVVLRGEIHGTRVLLLSDLGRPGQEKLMERESDLRAEIVIAGQPAQGEAVCDALLERMQPRVLVIVDSEYPAPERASPRLRTRLADWAGRQHATVLYTRETGAVQLQFRRGRWTLQTTKGETMRRASQTNVGGASP
jgi:competence protein ComEC